MVNIRHSDKILKQKYKKWLEKVPVVFWCKHGENVSRARVYATAAIYQVDCRPRVSFIWGWVAIHKNNNTVMPPLLG